MHIELGFKNMIIRRKFFNGVTVTKNFFIFKILEPREATQSIQQSVIQYGPHKVTEYNQAYLGGRLAASEAGGPLDVDEDLAREKDQRREAA